MDERLTRLWAGAEAEAIGHGGSAARAVRAVCAMISKRQPLRLVTVPGN